MRAKRVALLEQLAAYERTRSAEGARAAGWVAEKVTGNETIAAATMYQAGAARSWVVLTSQVATSGAVPPKRAKARVEARAIAVERRCVGRKSVRRAGMGPLLKACTMLSERMAAAADPTAPRSIAWNAGTTSAA